MLGGHGIDNVREDVAKTLSERCSRQTNHLDVWVHVDELLGRLAGLVSLVDDQQIETGEALALLQRLRRAHLNPLVWAVSPVARLQHPMLDAVAIKAGRCLVTQNNTIHNHR